MRAAEETYPKLGALFEVARSRGSDKMTAYEQVGRAIGQTGSWVRKFLGRQRSNLDADTYLSIKDAYERECARWDAEAELQKARFFALQGRAHAMAEKKAASLDVDAGRRPSRARRAPAVVAPVVGEIRR